MPERAESDAGAAAAADLFRRVEREVAQVLVGHAELVERMLLALVCDGHVLIEGVPGLGKSLAVTTLARALALSFKRIQFTPDLLPADVIGTQVFRAADGEFTVRRGPVFAEIVLADEINRAPPKVQSALLEAMQERQVTIGDATHALPRPFVVLATQNPIEHEGTYPLPEAELDRFLFHVRLRYPERPQEHEILERHGRGRAVPEVKPAARREELLAARAALDGIYADERILDYVLRIVAATREPGAAGLVARAGAMRLGASPRGALSLLVAAKGRALLRGRGHVTPADVRALAPDVLRHRLVLGFEAEAAGATADAILEEILGAVAAP